MWTVNAGNGSPASCHTTNPVLVLMRLVSSNVSFQAFQSFPGVVHNGSQNLHFEAEVMRDNCLFNILSYIQICSSHLIDGVMELLEPLQEMALLTSSVL